MSYRINGAPEKLRLERISVSGTAIQLAPVRPGRKSIAIGSSGSLLFGTDSSVTTSTGVPWPADPNTAAPAFLETASEIWGISTSSSSATVTEIYDEE